MGGYSASVIAVNESGGFGMTELILEVRKGDQRRFVTVHTSFQGTSTLSDLGNPQITREDLDAMVAWPGASMSTAGIVASLARMKAQEILAKSRK